MTQSDRWRQRKPVVNYRAYSWKFAKYRKQIPQDMAEAGVRLVCRFFLPIPTSYSKLKRMYAAGQVHLLKPDLDNLIKGVSDSLFDNDSRIVMIEASKLWADHQGPRTEIEIW